MCIRDREYGNATTAWLELIKRHLARFELGIDDVESFDNRFAPESTIWMWATFAPVRHRYEMAEPGREGISEDAKKALMRYFREFVHLSGLIRKYRQEYMSKLPLSDPMRIDEVEFRLIEADILQDLFRKGASVKSMRNAHCLPMRNYIVPALSKEPGSEDRRQFYYHLTHVLWRIKKAYEYEVEEMDTAPDPLVLSLIHI